MRSHTLCTAVWVTAAKAHTHTLSLCVPCHCFLACVRTQRIVPTQPRRSDVRSARTPCRSVAARVADLIGRLNTTEKIGLTGTLPGTDMCAGVDAGVPRLDIPRLSCLIECTGAVSSACYVDPVSGVQSCPTVFPAPLAVAARYVNTFALFIHCVSANELRFNQHTFDVAITPVVTHTHTHIRSHLPSLSILPLVQCNV
jgi:hypothetical protein